MQTLLGDIQYGFRVLKSKPGFAFVAVLTLALGIGANTAIFSVVYSVLLKPLPYKDAERIVIANISPPDFRDLKASNQSFDQLAIWASNLYPVNVNGETTQMRGAIVSPEFFPLLGLAPVVGRVWHAEEDNQPLVVLSNGLWQNQFGASAEVLGKTIRLGGKPHTIIGVMPPGFQYPTHEFKLWVTFGSAMGNTQQQAENRQLRIFRAVAHLKPDVTIEAMRGEMKVFSERLQKQFPDTNAGIELNFTTLYERLVGDVRQALFVLLATVGFVLLIACANVANLVLARVASREREIAVRSAMGASRGRIVRQLLTESLVLSAIGGALGLLLAFWGIDLLLRLNLENLPRLTSISLNYPVLWFTLGITALTGILFGLIPAWQATRVSFNQSLKESGRGTAGNRKSRRLRGALVVAEIALSLVVLIGAGLLIKSFIRLTQVDTGFVAENLLTANVGFVQFEDPNKRTQIQREVLQRIAQVPGMQAVGGGTGLPPVTPQRGTRFAVQGLPNDNADERSAYFMAVSPDYFRALGTKLIAGREFSDRDDDQNAKVVIINQALARRLFQNESALGKRFQLINPEQSNEWREVVGVVSDVRYSGLDDPSDAAIYTPFAQTPFLWNYLMMRTSVAPETLMNSVRQAILSVDPTLGPMNFQPMNQLLYESVAQPRFYTLLLGAFAVLSLILAAVGIYGVISYSVTQRTHEIGVRMALGAVRGDILRLIITEGLGLALIGVVLGLAGAYAATRSMSTLLFEVSATDPLTFFFVAMLLTLVALLASFIPAYRATKVDPVIALRYE
jgi:putative ABC transport system permease protein